MNRFQNQSTFYRDYSSEDEYDYIPYCIKDGYLYLRVPGCPRGPPGPPGNPGVPGQFIRGPKGYAGMPGKPGHIGVQGLTGEQGRRGLIGNDGERGYNGPKGENGERGVTGPVGMRGPPGEIGFPGQMGKMFSRKSCENGVNSNFYSSKFRDNEVQKPYFKAEKAHYFVQPHLNSESDQHHEMDPNGKNGDYHILERKEFEHDEMKNESLKEESDDSGKNVEMKDLNEKNFEVPFVKDEEFRFYS
ncbi:hypothetical protein MHBO_004152 [Bonamia ostreae]|uniref:Uncharacterized protein n=1 Tax=Bonamia ostreae TaxID=126728 RepID=A0ABV2ASJ0_9EUKA